MKNFRLLIAIMAAVITFGTAQAETLNTTRSSRSKNPWQILMITLNNHYVDTTGFSVVTSIDADMLNVITPDLAKAYHVKEKVDLSHAQSLGDVICEFMRVKYAGRTGQTYDYYKYCYSRTIIHDQYLERYPDSPYATEMRLKGECLKQYTAWSYCYDTEDYLDVLIKYESSYCPYGGFTNIASANNTSRESAAYYIQAEVSQKGYPYNSFYDYLYDNGDGSNYGSYNLGEPYYNFSEKEDSNDDNEIATLVTPNSQIGHSVVCIGNMGNKASLSVSFSGPSSVDVVLDHGQFKWVDLENGEYEVIVTSNNGCVWSPNGSNSIAVKDGVYMTYWCDYNGKLLSSADENIDDHIDNDAGEQMVFSVLNKAIGTLSDLLKLDHETTKELLIHYIQQTMDPDEQYKDAMELIYNELTEDIMDWYINTIKNYLEGIEEEYNPSYFIGKTYNL